MDSRVKIGIIGDYDEAKTSHAATNEALRHCSDSLSLDIEIVWLPTECLQGNVDQCLTGYDAFWGAPGSPYYSFMGAINGIRYARENDVPFLGTCGGFQHAVLEYAINVLGIKDAGHQELSPGASNMVVTALACSLKGRAQRISLKERSAVRDIYGTDVAEERYNCSFGLSPEFRDAFESSGFHTVGEDENGNARILEMQGKDFYIVTLFQPQLTSAPENPHRLILAYLLKAKRYHDWRAKG